MKREIYEVYIKVVNANEIYNILVNYRKILQVVNGAQALIDPT